MTHYLRRGIFLLMSALGGGVLAAQYGWRLEWGVGLGLGVACVVIAVEVGLQRVSVRTVAGGLGGLVVGVASAGLVVWTTRPLMPLEAVALGWQLAVVLTLGYFGVVYGASLASADLAETHPRTSKKRPSSNSKIIDTSVIIDGRIADLCDTGFLEGTFIIPQFILKELQYIADSPDPLKRTRGRRGLDILNRMQKQPDLDIQIVDDDFPQIREVDGKLTALGKQMGAKIVTNDLNLNKVAVLQGVKVLNVNELCHALKPVVLPGESLRVFVLKDGREPGQGVAYLDDGTMIVVEDGKRYIGRNAEVMVSSVLQTAAGRMIFVRLRENQDKEEPHRVAGSK